MAEVLSFLFCDRTFDAVNWCFHVHHFRRDAQYGYIMNENSQDGVTGIPSDDLKELVLFFYKAEDKCPDVYGTIFIDEHPYPDCRKAAASTARNNIWLSGLFMVAFLILTLLNVLAAKGVLSEVRLVHKLSRELAEHPSHLDLNHYKLGKKLMQQNGSYFNFAGEDVRSTMENAAHLKEIFHLAEVRMRERRGQDGISNGRKRRKKRVRHQGVPSSAPPSRSSSSFS